MKSASFVVACKEFFGLHPNQTLMEFSKELKQLTEDDRKELKALFPSVGYQITD